MKLINVKATPPGSDKKLIAEVCMCKGTVTKCKPEDRKYIPFGSKGSKTYAEGADEATMKNYLARHSVREDWNTVNAGSLSRYVLWSAKSIKQGISNFNKMLTKDK